MDQLGMRGTKWLIFETAVNLFAEQSYNVVSVRDLARVVGIKAASLYNHFKNKEEILTTIYEFYDYYFKAAQMDLEELMAAVDSKTPGEVFHMMSRTIIEELQPLMAKAMLVVVDQSRYDKQAEELIHKNMIDTPKRIVKPVLEKMIEQGKIEPLDLESFLNIYSSFQYSAAIQTYSGSTVDSSAWNKGIEMIFKIIKVKEA